MDDQRTAQTVGVLRAGVGVIPICAGLGDLDERVSTAETSKLGVVSRSTYGEVVSEGRARSNWALGDSSRAIHVVGAIHVEAVEV